MTDVEPALEQLTALVPFLRWRIGDPVDDELVGAALAADDQHLAAVVTASRPAWHIDDPVVLASLWWQAYAYRVAGTALACWLLTGVGPIPTATGIGRHRPSSIVCDTDGESDLELLVRRLFTGHLDGVADALRRGHRVGERLLWGNAAAGVASALLAVAGADGSPLELHARAPEVTDALPHDMPTLGRWHGGEYARATCCLWFKTPGAKGTYCSDCSFLSRD